MDVKIVEFSEMTTLELYDCLKLRSDVFIIEQNCHYPDVDLVDKEAHHLLAYKGDLLVGYLRIYNEGKSVVKIGRVLVAKEYRGKGCAKMILLKAIDFVRALGISKMIKIAAQEHLKSFYQSFGFVAKGTPYLDYKIMHVDMELDLK